MDEKFFKKVAITTTVFDRKNQPIKFEITPSGIGVIKLDDEKDAELIEDLNAKADARQGGIVRISAEIYEAEKKKTSSRPLRRQLGILNQIRVSKPPELFKKRETNSEVVQSAVKNANSAIVPKPELAPTLGQFKSKVRRLSEASNQLKPIQ
jgi:hypothetical protein